VAVHEPPRNDETEVDADGISIAKPTNIVVSMRCLLVREKTFQRLVQLHYLAAAGYITNQKLKEYIGKTVSGVPFSLEDSSAKDAINLGSHRRAPDLGRITGPGNGCARCIYSATRKIPGLLAQTYLLRRLLKQKSISTFVIIKKHPDRSYDKEADSSKPKPCLCRG
jgi:bacterioferritin-associated ferredoxin